MSRWPHNAVILVAQQQQVGGVDTVGHVALDRGAGEPGNHGKNGREN